MKQCYHVLRGLMVMLLRAGTHTETCMIEMLYLRAIWPQKAKGQWTKAYVQWWSLYNFPLSYLAFPLFFTCFRGYPSSHFKRLPTYPYFSLYEIGKKGPLGGSVDEIGKNFISIIFTLFADKLKILLEWILINIL